VADKKKNTTKYRRIFCDIIRRYTRVPFDGGYVFIKHLTAHDQIDLEDIEEDYYKKAQDKGLPTERESLDLLIKEGAWTKEDDAFVDEQELYIENLNKGKQQLMLKSQLDQQDKQIEEARAKLVEKLFEKEELLGNTCEKYSKKRLNDHYISQSFYTNEKLSKPLYSKKEFEEVGYSQLGKMVVLHNDQFRLFSEDNIQQTILEDFFYPYMPFSENSMEFFGQPVCDLTHNQLKLILFARVFKNIFDNTENIPEEIRKDPQALLDFSSTSRKGKEELDKHEDKGGATTIVGATKEDYEYMGVESGDRRNVSLHEAAKNKGGTLDMKDLMDMTGS